MKTFEQFLVEKVNKELITFEEGGISVGLNEGAVRNLFKAHPFSATVVAGLAIKGALDLGTKKANSEIVRSTNLIRFFARGPVERKIQQHLVDDLVSTGHYSVSFSRQTKDAFMWVVKRKPRS